MDKHHIDIEKYLDGNMTDQETTEFELRVEVDPQLATQMENERNARRLITAAGRLELKTTLDTVDAEMRASQLVTSDQGGKIMPLWMKRALPIAAMAIVFLGLFQLLQTNSMTSSEVYDTYFNVYEAPSALRSTEGNKLVNWEKASQLYAEGNYREAISYFAKSESEVPGYLTEFYKGMSNLSLDGPYYQRAITAFDKVLATDNDYVEQAQWYKAFALFQIQDKEEVTQLLEEIVANKSYNHEKAAALLEVKLKE